ncbi:pentatricopeptide repeat-containing protein At5g15010, mitochondrial isoform X2 [Punica granatum]|uniref:Pentatricopeptide repeat-containing protein At5g15010, mitochondrial isoform X2 n=1 Tax=Punica granatum TaxID=22663 RepID=A0A6P8DCB5_PUNGR|nr:pentatricopeptide repeat-containing protein At5g15010, mitochondrial isoform X2 [Punica granatum]
MRELIVRSGRKEKVYYWRRNGERIFREGIPYADRFAQSAAVRVRFFVSQTWRELYSVSWERRRRRRRMRGIMSIRRFDKAADFPMILRNAFSRLAGVHFCPSPHALDSPSPVMASASSPFCSEAASTASLPSFGSSAAASDHPSCSSLSRLSSAFPSDHSDEPGLAASAGIRVDDLDCSEEEAEEDDDEVGLLPESLLEKAPELHVKTIVDILRDPGHGLPEKKAALEHCIIAATSALVVEVLSRVRNDWEAAFTFFLWAGKQPGYTHCLREFHSMISILAKMRKFDTAWALIDEMRGRGDRPSMVTPHTLLIMIRKYCAVHDVGRAVNAFYLHKKYGLEAGIDEFQGLLSALCRYKNVQDAEHLMFCNRTVFPLNTKSFNIILNGWCNVIIRPRDGERIWREMGKRGVAHDVVSYASLMSCYSKTNSLNMVLKLFNRMKQQGISPDRKVYNAVIHALVKAKHVNEAVNLLKTMEEKGIVPNIVTYNSLIKPLCKARRLDEARKVFDEMLQRSLRPTARTFNAFLRILKTGKEIFELLEKMKDMGCPPCYDTYIMLIRKFCRWRQLDDVFRLWSEMSENGLFPDRSSYIVLIHGLFLNGKLEEAHKYYEEMKSKQFLPEPKTDEMLQAWISGREVAEWGTMENQSDCNQLNKTVTKKFDEERDFLRQPETRRVVRKQGYSFWEK